ncbi:hypothetical protein GGR51DRAFT_564127 [Nemania sp. FL0031]|nr:hypothetical protein GGR51DRAFT_564127 [Nemania sp. FL0031]
MSDPRPLISNVPLASNSPVFKFSDDGGRPKVNGYVTTSKYRVDDRVYIVEGTTREGPYKIETVPYAGKYTLCYDNGHTAKNGAEFGKRASWLPECYFHGRTRPHTNHFALPIGVNVDSERPLKGCVHNVREIARSLDGYLDNVHIQLFAAEDESAHATSSGDIGITEILATYSNIKAGLEKMSSLAKRGTHVYIHYSGHGSCQQRLLVEDDWKLGVECSRRIRGQFHPAFSRIGASSYHKYDGDQRRDSNARIGLLLLGQCAAKAAGFRSPVSTVSQV